MTLVALHGGGAAKVSDEYEDLWTLYSMLDLLAGRARAIKLEPPGSAGHGFEFFLRRGRREEWHQVKFQHKKGKWTLSALDQEDVLRRFKDKLDGDPKTTCRFVSSHSTYPLSKLCAHAAKARTLNSFKTTFLTSQDLKDCFRDLKRDHWKLTDRDLWDWLRGRVFVSLIDDELLETTLEERLATYVTGKPNDALIALDTVRRATLYNELSAVALEAQLTEKGCPPRALAAATGSVADLVRATSQTYVEQLDELLIHHTFMASDAVTRAKRALRQKRAPGVVLVTGLQGAGKSSVIGQVTGWALTAGWSVLSLDVGSIRLERDSEAVGRALGLPMPPARALSLAAVGGRGLLVIDALDSASLNRDKTAEVFPVIDQVIKEARANPDLTLLVSCRSEDLDADERLRALVHTDASLEIIDVPPLNGGQVRASLVQAGIDVDDLDNVQLELVGNPALLKQLIDSQAAGPLNFRTAEELRARYIDFKVGL